MRFRKTATLKENELKIFGVSLCILLKILETNEISWLAHTLKTNKKNS